MSALIRRRVHAAQVALCWHGHATVRGFPAEVRLRFWSLVARLSGVACS